MDMDCCESEAAYKTPVRAGDVDLVREEQWQMWHYPPMNSKVLNRK